MVPLAGKGCGKTVSQIEVTRHFHPSLVTCLAAKSTPAAYNGDPFLVILSCFTSMATNEVDGADTYFLLVTKKSPCIYIKQLGKSSIYI